MAEQMDSYHFQGHYHEMKQTASYRIKKMSLIPYPMAIIIQSLPEYNTKMHLMVRHQFWRSEECGVSLHCHYSQVHSDPEW